MRTDEACDDDVGTERDADKEIDEQADNRRVVADGREGICADELTEHQRIRRIEELLQHARERERQGKDNHRPRHRTVQHINRHLLLNIHHLPPPSAFSAS